MNPTANVDSGQKEASEKLTKVTGFASREPPAMPQSPHIRMARWPKTPDELGKVYWHRERAHDKTGERVVFVVCTAGAFIGGVDTIKSE